MPAKAKVGSWLEGSSAAASEAYESSGSSASSSGSEAGENEVTQTRQTNGFVVNDESSDDEDEGSERDEVVDWDVLLPKLRPAMMDRSKKRRAAFVSRYLTVTDEAPPATNIPSVFTTLLSALPLVTSPDHIDQIVEVLTCLVKRDEALTEKKLKLGDKLVKWVTSEVDKVSSPSRTITPTGFMPYLLTILALLSTFNMTRTPINSFVSSAQFEELVVSLAIVLDCIESREAKGKENAKVGRYRKKVGIRVWRVLRELRAVLPSMLNILLTKPTSSPFRLSVLIGHVIGVALRLKPFGKRKEEDAASETGPEMVEAHKDVITVFYSTHVLSAKAPVSRYLSRAFSPFLAKFISYDTLTGMLIPTAERMLLRCPEITLELTADLLTSCPHDISNLLPTRLVPAILSASKSSNPETRAKAIRLLEVLCRRCSDDNIRAKIVAVVLVTPKTGKTSSAENRTCLFAMTAVVPPSDISSTIVIDTLAPLVGKEGNEVALQALGSAIIPHLKYLLESPIPISPTTATTLAKELGSSKTAIRRLLSHAIGEAVWLVHVNRSPISSEGAILLGTLAPILETNLVNASNITLTTPGGYLEGYVAAALALGPLQRVSSCSKLTSSSALHTLLNVGPKPSYLLNERVYTKLGSAMDSQWLLRVLESVIESKGERIGHTIRTAIGLVLIHLAFETKHSSVRRDTFDAISRTMRSQPRAMSGIMRESLLAWFRIQDETATIKAKAMNDEEEVVTSRSRDIGRLFRAIFVADPSTDRAVLEDIAVDYLILTHHPEISEDAQTSWTGLLQSLALDPATIAADRKERIMKAIWGAASIPPQDTRLAEAAYRAVATLSFISPILYVPAILDQVRADLDPAAFDCIGLEERGVWQTSPDQTFVDVLSTKKETAENKNRKEYATEKWEQEIRELLAKKKAAAAGATLSKQDMIMVAAQLAKEAEVRRRTAALQARVKRGVELVLSLIASNAEKMERHVGEMAKLLLVTAFGSGSFLLDGRPFEVFLQMGGLASEKLGEYRRMLVAAILRSFDAPFVPEDYLHEPVLDLVTRLLHQIYFLSEQTPLDSTTYVLVSMLLSRVVDKGGVGTSSPQSEEAQEQLTLVVNIVASCCGEFQDNAYPRLQTIRDLLRVIANHSKLAKDAASALTDLGAAIKDVATADEIREMIAGTLSKDPNVRNGALQALQPVDLTDFDYSEELWIASHDEDEQNALLASHVWEDNGLDVPESYLTSLLRYLDHESAAVRLSCASALFDAAEHFPSQVEPTIKGLQETYAEKAKVLQPEYDRFGMVIAETTSRTDPFDARIATALALEKMAPLLSQSLIAPIFDFLITREALGDRNSAVRKAMLNAGIAVVDRHGAEAVTSLMKMFEEYLGRSGPSSETADFIKEAVVILFGRLARHLDSEDPRIPQVVDRLVEALNTPSELVQSAVADCLPPLVQGMSDEVEYLVDRLFSTLTTGAKYAGRRGAAYGLAGVVKGRGLQLLKEYDMMDKLKDAAEDKSAFQSRQGALFAFETLSVTLGKAFEPYILSIVPLLLTLFGDSNTDVREATQDCSRVIMSRISGHCVKLMLPTLLGGLEEKQWRTKKGSIELLGAMAFCAPRQLSQSLPTIIPQLTGVINDSHAQVKSAANTSLKRFGEVLSNPEIKSIQSTLMKALADPTGRTNAALAALLQTSFEHYLDSPSLALVMPIIDRGLRQRSSETKRKAVQIVGNMASLAESRDLVPYLNELMPLVHEVLVDPVPEARATAAKSLGTLVERLGEPNFPTLVTQLLQTLRTDTSGVDRQGAAQGLSEVLSGLGMERLEGLLPEVITNTASPRPYVREGFISLLVYLPATFGHRFAPHLGRVIPPILNGLADDSEYVREASMRAGKMIISNYSNKAIDLLLPELEKGMLDGAWRIRQSSISLTGDLLYRVTGISGKVELEEEEVPAHSADNARKALLETLGEERRDRVLATLYIVRQDTVGIVRQASIHIWKALVQNTPKTTREILPVLMQLLMSLLGSPQIDQQETASRTLGELCRKNGERIFGEIIPILKKAITSPDERTKEGACFAFSDVMAATSKDVIADYEDAIISAVRTALVDSSAAVRTAAARTFDTMQHYIGAKAIDQTIPTLLEAMRSPGKTSETALQALKEVMSVRANSVFPVLVPTLIAQPITAFNARALGALVKVAGSALNRRLDTVLGALVMSLEKEKSESIRGELQSAIEALLSSITDGDGVHLLEMLLIGWAKDHNPRRRATACNVFATMCQVNTADTTDYRVNWIQILVNLFGDPTQDVVSAAWEALEHFVKTVDKDELEDLVVPLRRSIESAGPPRRHVPGFSRPKGVQSIVPILLVGVLSGTQEQREQAALGIGDLVQRTSEAAIKPYIIQLTGPLIRVISGQALAPQIKTAILSTLAVLLEEVSQLVRPFHPQLTRTFVKSASDPAAISVRNRAAAGLGELMKHQPRVDPLITELIGGVRSGDKDIAPSMALALAAVCSSAGKNIGPAAKASIVDLAEEAFMESRGENYHLAIGKMTSGLAKNDAESIRSIVDSFLAAPTPPTPLVSIMILAVLEEVPDAFYELDAVEDIVKKVVASVATEQSGIARPAREARDLMRSIKRYEEDKEVQAALR